MRPHHLSMSVRAVSRSTRISRSIPSRTLASVAQDDPKFTPARSWLYGLSVWYVYHFEQWSAKLVYVPKIVPASSDRMLEKSLTNHSDMIIYDLEDSVPPSQQDKDTARSRLVDFLKVIRICTSTHSTSHDLTEQIWCRASSPWANCGKSERYWDSALHARPRGNCTSFSLEQMLRAILSKED